MFNEQVDERVISLHISGELVKADYAKFEPPFERLATQYGTPRLLFDMTGFHG